ncbi:MAG: acyl-CoA dehydrogenase, partial [Bacteroidota bacterium]
NGEQFKGAFVAEKVAVQNLKKATLLVLGATAKELMQQLKDEQEILMDISDMMANTYVAESVLLRVEKLANKLGEEAVADQIAMMKAYVADAVERVGLHGRDAIRAWAEGDMRKLLLKGLRVYTRFEGVNTKKARRQVANSLLAANTYTF